tara:strand:- start:203 stop:328 length:126 start_codon:yes stop_codon:yes gene_type:complete
MLCCGTITMLKKISTMSIIMMGMIKKSIYCSLESFKNLIVQ